MLNRQKFLSLLVVLLLAVGNMAFSAHVSSHLATDSGLCSLCIHPGGPDSAISHDSGVLFASVSALRLTPAFVSTHYLPVLLHLPQGRAPPRLT